MQPFPKKRGIYAVTSPTIPKDELGLQRRDFDAEEWSPSVQYRSDGKSIICMQEIVTDPFAETAGYVVIPDAHYEFIPEDE